MSDPTNQRADGCSIFFTLLSVVAISLLFVWIHGIFQPEQVEDVSENNRRIRMKKISNYIEGRHKLRDLNWYLNRLNLNSIGILYKAKINSSRYKKEFSTKIDLYEQYL